MIPDSHLGRQVHMWQFGSFGMPVVVFPSAAGFAHEWQAQGMIEALAPLLNRGKIKLYCPESNVAEAWTRKDHSPAERMQRHRRYEQFVLHTLLPYIRRDCGGWTHPVWTTGCSLGAMYSALFALKFPTQFNRALCMSGRYQATAFIEGPVIQDIYFNSPLHFMPNLSGDALQHVQRNTHLTLVCGQGKWEEGCIEETRALSALLQRKHVPHYQDIWGHDVTHSWSWWTRQARHHLGNWTA